MAIDLDCPKCRMQFSFPDELRGQTVRCKSCGMTFVVAPKAVPRTVPVVEPVRDRRETRLQDQRRQLALPTRRLERDEPPPARRRSRPMEPSGNRRAVTWVIIGSLAALALLVVLGGGIALYLLARPSRSTAPESSNAFASDASEVGGGVEGHPAAALDVPPLRYLWKGSPHIYHISAEVDHGDYLEVHEGNCTLNVNPGVVRGPGAGDERKGSATGFVVNPNGWLITCAHVAANAREIKATIGGKIYPAQVVAVNQAADVAIIRVQAQGLPSLALGNSDQAEVGQDVWALGYPLSDLLGNNLKVTRGTLSGVNIKGSRKVLQVDAAINYGNSGGPVVSDTGMVLGVASAKLVIEDVSNVGFAAPINEAKRLLTSKNVPYSSEGWTSKLDGPALVKRVSAATAFLQVTKGPRQESGSSVLRCNGHLQKSKRGKPGANFIPPIPGFDPPFSSQVEMDASGEVIHATRAGQLPCLLGDVVLFLIDPLPDDDRASWESSNPCTIEESAGGGGSGPGFGRPGFPGFPGRPFGPPGMPRMPGMPGFGGPANDRQSTTRAGSERTTYTRQPAAGDSVTIQKRYELKVPPTANSSSSITLTGNGDVTFDTKRGLPRAVRFTATLNVAVRNITQRIPVTVTCTLIEGAERDRLLNPPAPQQQPGEQKPGPQPGGAPAKPGGAPAQPPPLVGPAPPTKAAEVSLPLPGIGAVTVGGAGRLLILHILQRREISIFDIKQGKIVKSLPASEVKMLLAAGRNHLVVYLPGADKLERWNLTTFQREESAPNPTGGEIKNLALGSASSGPLVVHTPSASKPTLGIQLLDPRTFQPWNDSIEPIEGQPFGIEVNPDLPCVSVSADGGLILLRGKFAFTALSRQGQSWRGHNFGHAHMGGLAIAAADSQAIFDNGQPYSPDAQPLGASRGGHGAAIWLVPAVQGGLTVSLNEAYVQKPGDPYIKAMLHAGSDPEPLATFPRKIDALAGLVDWFFGRPQPFERHVFYAPEASALVVIPKTKDRLELHRFNLDELLKDSKSDYLFALSQPLDEAVRGSAYRYPVVVKSKAGNLKYTLDSGPSGMKLGSDGVLTWPVPADVKDSEAEVSLTVASASGKEIRQGFRVHVVGK